MRCRCLPSVPSRGGSALKLRKPKQVPQIKLKARPSLFQANLPIYSPPVSATRSAPPGFGSPTRHRAVLTPNRCRPGALLATVIMVLSTSRPSLIDMSSHAAAAGCSSSSTPDSFIILMVDAVRVRVLVSAGINSKNQYQYHHSTHRTLQCAEHELRRFPPLSVLAHFDHCKQKQNRAEERERWACTAGG